MPFEITDDRDATWALKKIRAIRAENERLVNECKKQIDIYQHRIALFNANEQNYENELTNMLAAYFQTIPDEKKRRTASGNISYILPEGKIRYKKPSVEYVRDDQKLLNELDQNGLIKLVREKREPDWATIKKLINSSDESGAEITAQIEDLNLDTGEFETINKTIKLTSIKAQPTPGQIVVELDKYGTAEQTFIDDEEDAE